MGMWCWSVKRKGEWIVLIEVAASTFLYYYQQKDLRVRRVLISFGGIFYEME